MAKKKAVTKNLSEDQSDTNQASIAMKPTDRTQMMAQAVNLIGVLDNDKLGALAAAMAQIGKEADPIPDDASAKNQASIQMKGQVAEDLEAIFGGDENLSEEFRSNIQTLFEAAVSGRVAVLRQEIQEEIEAKNEEEIALLVESLRDQLDGYITYAAQEWMKNNEVAIRSELTSEIHEDFMQGLRDLFVEHYINIPEEQVDVVEELAQRLEQLESAHNEIMEENIELTRAVARMLKTELVDSIGEGLTVSQKTQFKNLVEDIEFDPETFESKARAIRNTYFDSRGRVTKTGIISEDVSEQPDAPARQPVSGQMAKYLSVGPKK